MITLLDLAQAVRFLTHSHKPVGIFPRFFHDSLDGFHTLTRIFLNRILLPLHQDRITEHLMPEKHCYRMAQKIILNLLMHFRLPVRISFRRITTAVRNIRTEDQNIISLRHNIQI